MIPRHRMHGLAPLLAALVLVLPGCGGRHAALTPARVDGAYTRIDDGLAGAPDVEALVAPYRTVIDRKMGEPLAVCPRPLDRGQPEGELGALVADMVLARARRDVGPTVDACVLNDGGLRIPWPAGTITLGLVYELMPFDNEVVVVRLAADQMRTLADEIAARRGEPVAGMSFRIAGKRAADLRVGGAEPAPRDYWVATNSYLADGGGGMPTLWAAQEVRRTGVLVRDAIADALRGITAEWRSTRGAAEGLGTIPLPEMGRVRE
jgi:2',3'-cyclic-nucleotide 2'-phosphodiesterase (5'-nucleotidase family)